MDVFGRPSPFCADEKILNQLFSKIEQMVINHMKKEIDPVKRKIHDLEIKYDKRLNELDEKNKTHLKTADSQNKNQSNNKPDSMMKSNEIPTKKPI